MQNLTTNTTNTANAANTATDQQQGQKQVQPKKRPATPKIWKVLGKAKRAFELQLTISNDVKRQCIERQIGTATIYPDRPKFWSEFLTHTERLLDSRKYVRECEILNVPSENLAEHIVFLGSSTINKVLKNGILNTLGKDFSFYRDPITNQEIKDIFSDKKVSIEKTVGTAAA